MFESFYSKEASCVLDSLVAIGNRSVYFVTTLSLFPLFSLFSSRLAQLQSKEQQCAEHEQTQLTFW
jgi:hypothetical protein